MQRHYYLVYLRVKDAVSLEIVEVHETLVMSWEQMWVWNNAFDKDRTC